MSRKMARPLVLTMDAFGTLFTPKEPVERQYCKVAKEFGLVTQEKDVKAAFRQAFKSLSTQYPNYGAESGMQPRTWWSSVIQETFKPLLSANQDIPDNLVPALYTRFSSSEGYRLYDDVVPFLRRVRSAGSPESAWQPSQTILGVISNSDPRVKSILASFGIHFAHAVYPAMGNAAGDQQDMATFSFAALSYDIGVQKPSSKIYKAAKQVFLQKTLEELRRAGYGDELPDSVDGFRFVHVGDDLKNDVIPALDSGWDAVLLDRDAEASKGEEMENLLRTRRMRIIKTLDEMNSLL